MSRMPFFSIVIPTRNRPKLLQHALLSALQQEFDDFEVVVSNNSTDTATQEVIARYQSDPRVRSYRPENLSMPEHWEYATQLARGRYVLVLTDRSVLKRHALKTIHAAISASGSDVQVCAWRWSLYDDAKQQEFADIPVERADEVVNLESEGLLRDYVLGLERYQYELPRGLNCCYRNDVAAEIRREQGALFPPISPDFTLAFLLLSRVPDILFIDAALFISQGLQVSNGGNATSTTTALASYMQTLKIKDYYAHVPIKSLLVANLIFEDFLNMREKAAGKLKEREVDWTWYFVVCYREIQEKRKMLSAAAQGEYVELMQEWERALATFDAQLQKKVRDAVREKLLSRIKAGVRRRLGGLKLIRLARDKWRGIPPENAGKHILTLAGFDSHIAE